MVIFSVFSVFVLLSMARLFYLSHGSKIVKYVHFLCMHGSQRIHVLACLRRMMDMLSLELNLLSYKLFNFFHSY